MNRSRNASALAVLVGVAVAGCSSSPGTAMIAKSDVEKKAVTSITAKVGVAPKSISCPHDLDAAKGAREVCVLTAPNGDTVPVTITVTSASGSHYTLDFQVGTKVTPAPASS